jgi:hypothetical protein
MGVKTMYEVFDKNGNQVRVSFFDLELGLKNGTLFSQPPKAEHKSEDVEQEPKRRGRKSKVVENGDN